MADHLRLDDHRALPLVWLREMCVCPGCVHPSGQRLLDPAAIPVDLAAATWTITDDGLHVTWAPDGHESVYRLADLEETAPGRRVDLWDATAAAALPVSTYPLITSPDRRRAALREWLRGVNAMGCGLLRGLPTADGEVARVAEIFGHVRVTNYGRFFDVRSVVDPTNLADTSLGLPAHTDNPYRDPVPTLQLLHCLQSSAAGGDNVLVDGWRVADDVRALDPAGFELLATRDVTFRYTDATTDLSATAPIIGVRTDGTVQGVRFNARSMQPPRLPSDESAQWYAAYTLFARLSADPAYQVRLRLEPGDLFVVDNRRVLHGRTGFETSTGTRHLQGCYADIDGLRSTLAVLERDAGA